MKRVLEGLQILIKYFPDGDMWADHDIIGLETIDIEEVEISEEDKKKLDKLGWFISLEFDCWSKFV